MVRAEKSFERPNRDYGTAANLASREKFCCDVILDRSRGNAQHQRCLTNADSEFVLLVHARRVRQRRAASPEED
jgi:hypothetical protein